MENFYVRRVTTEDFDKVIAIRKPEDVYNGMDYLPCYFTHLINSENVMAFAVVAGNDFAAFDIAFFVDGGEKVVTRAARVSKNYEGHGVMKYLWNHIQEVIQAETSVKWHIYWLREPSQIALQKLGEQGYKVVVKKKTMIFTTNKETIMKELDGAQNTTPSTAKQVNQAHLEEIFDNKNLLPKLFPQEILTVDWVPYSLIKSNIPLIFSQTTSAVRSGTDDIGNNLLTFGTHFQTLREIVFNIDIYASHFDNIVLHLSEHINTCNIESETTKMLIRFYYDDLETNDQLLKVGKSLTLPGNITEFESCFCVEKNLGF